MSYSEINKSRLPQCRSTVFPGRVFGRLTVTEPEPDRIMASGRKVPMERCRCECGNEVVVFRHCLTSGNTKSCGCLRREMTRSRSLTHGATSGRSNTTEYNSWLSMKSRVKIRASGYEDVSICDRWAESFESFHEDMGDAPSDKHSIDRIEPSGNYEPSNCRWATDKEQANNKRNNVRISFYGVTKTLTQWCEISGVDFKTAWSRLNRYGWSEKASVWTPYKKIVQQKRVMGFYGKSMPLSDWCKISGVSRGVAVLRLKHGWPNRLAVWTPAGSARNE